MHTRRRTLRLTAAAGLVLALTGAGMSSQATTPPLVDDGTTVSRPAGGTVSGSVLVRLKGAPLATARGVARTPSGRVILGASRTRTAKARLADNRQTFERWLDRNAPRATVTSRYDYALNAVAVRLGGVRAAKLRQAPGVAQVVPQRTYFPLGDQDPDLGLIDGQAGWIASGATSTETKPETWAGYGVKVGIVDSGIDITHPCFDDEGYDKVAQRGQTAYTNNKVIVARVFNNKLNQSGYDAGPTVDSHGTHVAGTVGCNLHTPDDGQPVVDGATIPYDPSGVAPGALLGNYNVFPGDVASARSEDILNALQAAARDGMQVINMSLGGNASGKLDLLTTAIDNLDRSGIVVAVSAGNSGPGEFTIGSPGSAERALTAGASTVGHYVGVLITSGSETGSELTVAATGDFPVPDSPLTAPLAVVKDGTALSTACTPAPADSLAGKIALVSRGGCTFAAKNLNAQAGGAVAVIVVNNVAGDPTAMGGAEEGVEYIPAVMAPLNAKATLMAQDGNAVTIGASPTYERSTNDNILAGFSSRGPVDVSYRVKPDVVAPGVNVLSSVLMSECQDETWAAQGCWAFYQGTSMASPHLAGMAAVVRKARPTWDAWMVRSAIANTAKQEAVTDTATGQTTENRVQYVGNGLADLDAAVGAQVAFSRPTVSFGSLSSGRGASVTTTVAVTNLSASSQVSGTPTLSNQKGPGVFSLAGGAVTLAPGETKPIRVTVTVPRRAEPGHTQAVLEFGGSHVALYAYVK